MADDVQNPTDHASWLRENALPGPLGKNMIAAAAEIERLRGGWLRVIQAENGCRATGLPCASVRCACVMEQEALAKVEDEVRAR